MEDKRYNESQERLDTYLSLRKEGNEVRKETGVL